MKNAFCETAFTAAFLNALFRKLENGTSNGKTTIPTGVVDNAELFKVLVGLKCVGWDRTLSNNQNR